MELLKEIGKNIRKQRRSKNYSQEELAERADLHRTFIGGIERGERNITILTLQKIALALESPLTELLPKNEKNKTPKS